MKADFSEALELLIELEGGYVRHNHATDRGGDTWAGICRKWWPDWEGWEILDGTSPRGDYDIADGSALGNHVMALTADFYRDQYWDPLLCADLPHSLATALLCDAVNRGRRRAVRDMQASVAEVCVRNGFAGPAVDGWMGPATVAAVQAVNGRPEWDDTLTAYHRRVCRFYAHIASDEGAGDPDALNLKGWLARADKEFGL